MPESPDRRTMDARDLETFPLSDAGARYSQWLERLRAAKAIGAEHLLPRLRVPCPRDLPRLMAVGARSEASNEDLRARIDALRPWGYGIQLREGVVTEKNPVALERMIYRSHLISGAVRMLCGDALPNSSFIDLACNHGYFSLELAAAGARETLGVDLRAENVEKARFLKDQFGIANARFEQRDIYDLGVDERFDVVLNLGVLYHVTDPFRLLQLTFDLCRRFAVVDSIMHKEPVSAFVQRVNKDVSRHAEGKFSVELHPTYRAVIDLMFAVGFVQVIEVVPELMPNDARCPHELYDRHDRRCLIGFKEPIDLSRHTISIPDGVSV